jgi:DNA-binding response OmpR family regulator
MDMEHKPDVLVVDDDKVLNKLICHFVRLAGHTVRSALDGGSALLAAQEQPPMLVLLDLMLPDTSGFEVCLELKRNERTRSVPVVMVTAMGDEESRARGMECGAAEYLVKPFRPEQLMETIKKYAA